jgi:hypothetical protein
MPDVREDERVRRVGLNEAVFRALNEQIEALNERFPVPGTMLDVVCECGRADCAERIRIERQAYERLRADPLLFAILPGHERPEAERIVEVTRGYNVVQKLEGMPADIARQTSAT